MLPHQLCNQGPDCQRKDIDCIWSHPDWPLEYCPLFLKGITHNSANCLENHIPWATLAEIINHPSDDNSVQIPCQSEANPMLQSLLSANQKDE